MSCIGLSIIFNNDRQANLKMLFDRAREYEKASFKGLFHFINYINSLRKANNDMDSAKVIFILNIPITFFSIIYL